MDDNRFDRIEDELRALVDEACPHGARYALLILERPSLLTVLSDGDKDTLIEVLEHTLRQLKAQQ